MMWTDNRLTWDPTKFDNIDRIRIATSDVCIFSQILRWLFTFEFLCIILIYWKVLFQVSISKNCPILVFFDKISYMLQLALGSWCHLLQYGWTIYALGSKWRYHIFQWPGNLRSPCSDTGKCVDENFPKSLPVSLTLWFC